ncbi:hypothetical protein ACIP98_40415 [Streptomyces sp. NPDC088354]|uniref:hypothetical protein n=1 Tax=Streptomyces sp. NPDC088354 TaxID=3365856 RepID=UPI003820507D
MAALELTGCSGEKPGNPEVASIESKATAGQQEVKPTKSSAPDGSGCPHMRLDDSVEQRMQYRKALVDCLSKRGMGPGANEKVSSKVEEAALEACEKYNALPPPELDPSKNPDYAENVGAMIKCLNSHGAKTNRNSRYE